jgi:hypothetical protein
VNIERQPGITIDLNDVRHFLLNLHKETMGVTITFYKEGEIEQANADYMKAEKLNLANPNFDTVLVSAESLKSVREAFPNYFNFNVKFLETLQVDAVINFLTSAKYIYLSDPKE